MLARGATFRGGINLSGARLGADLDGTGATVQRTDGDCRRRRRDRCGRQRRRCARRRIEGEVRLVGSADRRRSRLHRRLARQSRRDALQASRAAIKGAFFLRKGAAVDGALALTGASIGLDPRRGGLLAEARRSSPQPLPLRRIHRRSGRCGDPPRLAVPADAGALGRGFLATALRAARLRLPRDGT